jgi:hypothetical protein
MRLQPRRYTPHQMVRGGAERHSWEGMKPSNVFGMARFGCALPGEHARHGLVVDWTQQAPRVLLCSATRLFRGYRRFELGVSRCCATPFRLLVQTKGSKEKDTRSPRRLRRSTPMLTSKGCGQNSGRFGGPQTQNLGSGLVLRKTWGQVLCCAHKTRPQPSA